MNKAAIKNFAIWARNKLIADISYRAGLMGITEEGIKNPLSQSAGMTEFYDIGTAEPSSINGAQLQQRKTLVESIRKKERDTDYKTAYKYILEEVAYTWFNRLIAVRFMEVNDYLPSHIRVLSSESGKLEPDLVTTPFDAGLHFNSEEEQTIIRLKQNNQLDELFRILFIKQCNELNDILPALFEHTGDYTELLLNLSVVDKDGVVYHLVHDIDEADFDVNRGGQVEIIGWLYQYYNTEPKDETFALLKKNVKITKERIPSATQLFTPDWIVRYMVENSLGRLWLEGHPNDALRAGWKYYLDEAEQEPEVQEQLEEIRKEYQNIKLKDIKVIDPCMGSGHILIYIFDVLMQIYKTQGYTKRDAVKSILENNLYGLDVDDRAAQLAYFAVMMKARSYDRHFFEFHIQPHVYSIRESTPVNSETLGTFGPCEPIAKKLIDSFVDAKEYGSLLIPDVTLEELETLQAHMEEMDRMSEYGSLNAEMVTYMALKEVWPLKELADILIQKYDVVVTNPPYMGADSMDELLSSYIKRYYPLGKADLFAAFIERCSMLLVPQGFQAMITMQGWMFLSSFEKIRECILNSHTIINMCHLGTRAFEEISGEVVQTVSWIMKSTFVPYNAIYVKLVNLPSQSKKQKSYLAKENRFIFSQKDYGIIPNKPIAYWISNSFQSLFREGVSFTEYVSSRDGLTTGKNELFIKYFWEVSFERIGFNCTNAEEFWNKGKRYAPLIKGGQYRKWYGNNWFVIKYDTENYQKLSKTGNKLPSKEVYFLPYCTWNRISTRMAFRYCEAGYLFESASLIAFSSNTDNLMYALSFANSIVAKQEMQLINPTTNMLSGYVDSLRLPPSQDLSNPIRLAKDNVEISKSDWDSFETSWDFKQHPLVRWSKTLWDRTLIAANINHFYPSGQPDFKSPLKLCWLLWKAECKERFNNLKANEEELNRFFIDICGLQDDLNSEIVDRDVSVRKAELQRDIRSLISYAVGCMFGRYSLDVEGIVYAGGKWDTGQYMSFLPDIDNIIPITDEEYLEDDIASSFCQWLKVVYGEETLENNLDFIAEALGGKGNTSREVIRNYFMKDFFRDHCKIYQKRPIYWLFDSGKQNGFKALIYLHRYTPDTIGILRVDYLHRIQRIYDNEITRMQDVIDHSHNTRESAQATKRKEELQKQSKECRDYDELLAHLALSRVTLDLDDGVKINYEKLQISQDGKKYEVLAKI